MAASGAALAQAGQAAGQQLGGAIPGFAQYFFGRSDTPYKRAEDAYNPHYRQSREAQNPFYEAGQRGMQDFQNWLAQMKDPSAFINKLMGNYQESPWAHIQQQNARRAGINAASASGLIGSTPYLQQAQQNAHNISQEDMMNWLKNVLGINTEYGQGQHDLYTGGQHAADEISNIERDAGDWYAQNAYNKSQAQQSDKNALWGGISKLIGG